MKILHNNIFTHIKGNYIKLGNLIYFKNENNQKFKIIYFNKYRFIKYYKLSNFISNEIKDIYKNL